KAKTTTQLKSYFADAQVLNTKMKIRTAQTESGVKDTFQEHFLGKLFGSYAKTKGKEKKQEMLDSAIQHLPS
ncbi:hypothetical protein FISHEDRAFT_10464, partial [Fistulina hepatica ATCC 64428]